MALFMFRGSVLRDGTQAALDRLLVAADRHATRPTRGRLTGGFAYRPPATTKNGVGTLRFSYRATAAAADLEKLGSLPEPSSHAAESLGIAYLVLGEPSRAIEQLLDAREANEQNARVLSDLGAAYLEVANSDSRPDAFVLSLDASERALRTGAAGLEARFNRALALEQLSLVREAMEAWRTYLEIEPSSEWATEASRHRDALHIGPQDASGKRLRALAATASVDYKHVLETVSADPDDARAFVEQDLLPQWAALAQQQQPEAAKALARLRVFGRALAEASGDGLFDHASLAIERCSRAGGSRCLMSIASGVTALDEGLRLSRQFDFSGAAKPFRRAMSDLESTNPPLALWAAFNLAVTSYQARDLDRAATEFIALEKQLAPTSYCHLLGRVASMRGLIDSDRAAFDDAIQHYAGAQAQFRRCREVESETYVANLLADTLRVLGDFRAAWRVRFGTLRQLNRLRPQRQEAVLLATARLAEAQGLFGASLNFHRAAVEIAMAVDGAAARAQVLVRRAATYAELGDTTAALNDAALAEKNLREVKDSNIRRRLEAELLVLKAGLAGDAGEAGAALDEALAFSRQAGLVNYLPRLHLLRGRRLAAQGKAAAAADAFDQGVKELESARMRTNATRLRVSFFDRSWNLFSEMVRLQFAARNYELAFNYAERGRGRTLSDAIASRGSVAASLSELRVRLPSDTRLLYYVLLEDQAVVWVVGGGQADLIHLPVSGAELNRQSRKFQRRLRAGHSALPEAERLYDWLLRPALGVLPQVTRLIVAADGELSTIPFAALRRRETGRFLIQDFVVESTPNATLCLRAQRGRSASPAAQVSVISVPESGQADLPSLPGVAAEARDVAALYPGARLLMGRATKAEFIAALRTSGIVHFAGHAIANVEYPELSRIILGPHDRDGGSALYADDLVASGDFRADLVVLSACSTGVGALSRGEGPISLARPLLIGGVRSVVASLWDVRDAPARELMVRFHRAISRGVSASTALREAQLEMIGDRDAGVASLSGWAAFIVFGGS